MGDDLKARLAADHKLVTRGMAIEGELLPCNLAAEALASINTLEAKLTRAEEALRFYARPQSWRSSSMYMCGHSGDTPASLDGGAKARAALRDPPAPCRAQAAKEDQ